MRSAYIILIIALTSCSEENKVSKVPIEMDSSKIIGTWKMVYSEIKENDSITIKDLTTADFVKIINKSHFAFFNQNHKDPRNFYGAGGTYVVENNQYTETLLFTAWENYRNQDFPFTIVISNDTLTQHGIEELKEENIKRYILEKYVRIN